MNDKEKELWRVIDNVIECCAIQVLNRTDKIQEYNKHGGVYNHHRAFINLSLFRFQINICNEIKFI